MAQNRSDRWSETKTRSFVTNYLSKPALWDAGSPEYSQKAEKLKAYESLMNEFQLTLNEVRNKIRIYRTTFMQEKTKEMTIANYTPRLSWYHDMKLAFKEGQVKSFAKSPMVNNKTDRPKSVRILKKEKIQRISPDHIEYEFIENELDTEEKKAENPTHIIIEPYDENDEEMATLQEENVSWSKSSLPSDPEPKSVSLLSSNELFLQSLRSSLDKLSEEKNMRARIKIQEVLYSIMYEKP